MATCKSILFAGGGSGGHIFPNIAVIERLREKSLDIQPHFLISSRSLDTHILKKPNFPRTVLPAVPLNLRPDRLIRFLRGYKESVALVRKVIAETGAVALVSTGGFVAAPAVAASQALGLTVVLVNLDAIPGRANRLMAGRASQVFTVYPAPSLHQAQLIGLPLRRNAIGSISAPEARLELGLDPDCFTLFVTAGSQGASTINRMMMDLCTRFRVRHAFDSKPWQVFHLTGHEDPKEILKAYEQAGIRARVEPFCNVMGLAWSAASIGISRAGAGSVAEVRANGVPTIFLPYPYHKDQHQYFNAEPLVSAGAAMMIEDCIDAVVNVNCLIGPLLFLMANDAKRETMRQLLLANPVADGADIIARSLAATLGEDLPGGSGQHICNN